MQIVGLKTEPKEEGLTVSQPETPASLKADRQGSVGPRITYGI